MKYKTVLLILLALLISCSFGCKKNDKDSIENIIKRNEGEIYTLQEAYEKGFLSTDELRSIAFYDGSINDPFDGTIIPKNPKELSDEMNEKIKISYLALLYSEENSSGGKLYSNLSLTGIHIIGYFGTYNYSIVVKISDEYNGYAGIVRERNIGGVNFVFNGPELLIWRPTEER